MRGREFWRLGCNAEPPHLRSFAWGRGWRHRRAQTPASDLRIRRPGAAPMNRASITLTREVGGLQHQPRAAIVGEEKLKEWGTGE